MKPDIVIGIDIAFSVLCSRLRRFKLSLGHPSRLEVPRFVLGRQKRFVSEPVARTRTVEGTKESAKWCGVEFLRNRNDVFWGFWLLKLSNNRRRGAQSRDSTSTTCCHKSIFMLMVPTARCRLPCRFDR